MDNILKKKRLEPSFMFGSMFKNILSSEIYHLTNFYVLIQSRFRVIQRIVFTYLCKAYHKVIIIQFEWKNWKGDEELQTIQYHENKMSFPGEIKSIFHDF